MRRMMSTSVIAAFLAALGFASGCVDTPLVPGSDYRMTLTANPGNVNVPTPPPETPDERLATSSIVATVLSDTGIPQQGYSVYFSSSSGALASNSSARRTDENGRAVDTLSIGAQDQASIDITAVSGTLTQTVSVTQNGACDGNSAPTARITGVPTTPQTGAAGSTVTVNAEGNTSTDVTPGEIVQYDWDCGNGQTSSADTTSIACAYTVGLAGSAAKIYTISLRVTDDGIGDASQTCHKSSPAVTATVSVGPSS